MRRSDDPVKRCTVDRAVREGALPNLVLIGAMKCGTSALHAFLDLHPQIAMSQPKELNFFFGPDTGNGQSAAQRGWGAGNWSHGLAWYASHFPADSPVRGESSPGYTSPNHPGVAERMAATIPGARLIYLVRDPIARAVSQYHHHRVEGTERRPIAEALLDPASQYISRGRYHERLQPFLARYPRERILVLAQEDLRHRPAPTLRRVFGFAGADDTFWCDEYSQQLDASECDAPPLEPGLRDRLIDAFRCDAERLRAIADQPLSAWSV
jgi:Sulfotransferase domain